MPAAAQPRMACEARDGACFAIRPACVADDPASINRTSRSIVPTPGVRYFPLSNRSRQRLRAAAAQRSRSESTAPPRRTSISFASALKQYLPESTVAHLQAFDHWLRGEPEVRLVHRLCAGDKSAIDVGANIGTYTYFMRKHARDVVTYEPNPQLAGRLQRLYPEVRVRNVAVSDHPARVVLRMPVAGATPMHELASIAQSFAGDGEVMEFEVDAVRLDDESLADVGFLKIDAEQHEREVLNGALATIQRWRPIIMTESTPLLYPTGIVAHFGFLTNLDYVGWFTFNKRVYRFDQFDPALHANPKAFGVGDFMSPNIFFFPREIPGEKTLIA